MLKKVMILVTVLVLVLTTAQLAQANQATDPTSSINATQQDTGGTHINTAGQTTAPDPVQQDTSQNQQPGGANQSTVPNLNGLMHLSDRNSLVIDCAAVSERLVHFNQLGNVQMSDPQEQAELARVKDLSQLCADGGYNPLNSSGSGTGGQPNSNSTTSRQPTSNAVSQPTSNTGSQPQSNTTSLQTRDSKTLGG